MYIFLDFCYQLFVNLCLRCEDNWGDHLRLIEVNMLLELDYNVYCSCKSSVRDFPFPFIYVLLSEIFYKYLIL